MVQPIQLPTPQFAVWARRAGVRLPYPIDITDVPGVGVAIPDGDAPILRQLADIAAAPRVSAFALRTAPDGTTECYAALAADRNAVLIIVDHENARVSRIDETELALSVVTALPALEPFRLDPVELPESDWQELSEVVERVGEQDAVAARFAQARLPLKLAGAMVRAVQVPVVVGVLGSSAWVGGEERLGPRLGAWHEYEAGAVLSERAPVRGRAGPPIRVNPFTMKAAVHILAAAVGDAVNAVAVGAEPTPIPAAPGADDRQSNQQY